MVGSRSKKCISEGMRLCLWRGRIKGLILWVYMNMNTHGVVNDNDFPAACFAVSSVRLTNSIWPHGVQLWTPPHTVHGQSPRHRSPYGPAGAALDPPPRRCSLSSYVWCSYFRQTLSRCPQGFRDRFQAPLLPMAGHRHTRHLPYGTHGNSPFLTNELFGLSNCR